MQQPRQLSIDHHTASRRVRHMRRPRPLLTQCVALPPPLRTHPPTLTHDLHASAHVGVNGTQVGEAQNLQGEGERKGGAGEGLAAVVAGTVWRTSGVRMAALAAGSSQWYTSSASSMLRGNAHSPARIPCADARRTWEPRMATAACARPDMPEAGSEWPTQVLEPSSASGCFTRAAFWRSTSTAAAAPTSMGSPRGVPAEDGSAGR